MRMLSSGPVVLVLSECVATARVISTSCIPCGHRWKRVRRCECDQSRRCGNPPDQRFQNPSLFWKRRRCRWVGNCRLLLDKKKIMQARRARGAAGKGLKKKESRLPALACKCPSWCRRQLPFGSSSCPQTVRMSAVTLTGSGPQNDDARTSPVAWLAGIIGKRTSCFGCARRSANK